MKEVTEHRACSLRALTTPVPIVRAIFSFLIANYRVSVASFFPFGDSDKLNCSFKQKPGSAGTARQGFGPSPPAPCHPHPHNPRLKAGEQRPGSLPISQPGLVPVPLCQDKLGAAVKTPLGEAENGSEQALELFSLILMRNSTLDSRKSSLTKFSLKTLCFHKRF